jgi:hypothetical protein
MTTAEEELTELLANLPPGVKLVYKEGAWWRFCASFMTAITFGSDRAFLNYTTTYWKTIAVPASWDLWTPESKLETLVHELVHVEQARKLSILFWFLYILFPFPVGCAWFRYKFERDAYLAGYRVAVRYGQDKAVLADEGAGLLSGASYGYAWPFRKKIYDWFMERL